MEEKTTGNFIHDIIDADLAAGVNDTVHTRFPPEPNGYLHIGSAKAIYISSSTAKKYGGLFNLRYDDTNPEKEDDEYVKAIYDDMCWFGAEPTGGVFFGSDYFDKCYEFAVKLIKDGKAYVCDLSREEFAEKYRGSLSDAGKESPYRNRTVEENLDLFERMKNGEFPDGSKTLRAKIDMSAPNYKLRDPAIYRIRHATHHRQGDKWCIYPFYDFAHPLQDALEGITYSLCDTGFIPNRALYDWVLDNVGGFEHRPHQYEFARLNITYTVMSKRYLRNLVETGLVDGWDDPRLPTLRGLRRRGYTPESIFDFLGRVGVSRQNSLVEVELLEHCIREELNMTAPRRIAVLRPIKVIVDNYPEGKTEYFEIANNPNDESAGSRKVAFTKELYIDADDFSLDPPPKFFRLKPDGEVRLMGAYIVKCGDIIKNEDGSIKEIHVTADIESGCNKPSDGRKVKGTIHWVSAKYAQKATVILYDRLFTLDNMGDVPTEEYDLYLNKESAARLDGCMLEASLADARPGDRFQFVRSGYYIKDTKNDNTFNLIVGLRDSFK